MTCRCDGGGWLPEMCVGRWRCPCSDGYTKNARNVEAWEHVEQLCAECEAMREKREVTDDLDYIKAEAERLPNGTAARFIEALDAMDGATEPMESDSDMNVKSLDSDKDVTSGLHARSKRLERSTPDALGQRDGEQSHVVPTSVTITISREDAVWLYECVEDTVDGFYDRRPDFDRPHRRCMGAIRAALEGER